MDSLLKIGSRIRAKREQQGISQQELADMVGYTSRSSINKIELGKTDLVQSKIAKIANALHTTPSYILGIEEEPSAVKQELLRIIKSLPEDKAHLVLDLIKRILQEQA